MELITRIHSPNSPASVDVHFTWHHRTRWASVEALHAIGYKLNKEPVSPLRHYSDSDKDMPQMHRRHGWKQFEWYYLDERRSEHVVNAITAAGLRDIHDTLFGKQGEGGLGDRISLRRTALLILASVGIDFSVAVEEGDLDGYQRGGAIDLEMHGNRGGVNAGHIRKICGIAPLKEDGACTTASQVTHSDQL